MHSILDWKSSEDKRDMVHILVQSLVEGCKLALPLETEYHAVSSGLATQPVDSVQANSNPHEQPRYCLLLRSVEELLDYAPGISTVAWRIASRLWPGPVGLELKVADARSSFSKLPEDLQKLLAEDGRVIFRVTGHEAVRQSLRLMPGPLVSKPLRTGDGPVLAANQFDHSWGFSLILDDRQTRSGQPATLVRIDGNLCRIIESGSIDLASIHRAAQLAILIVCTGNTCRSPMAAAIMQSLFEARFGGAVPASQKVFVGSAGLNAYPGGSASPEAVEVMKTRGLTIQDHQSRMVTAHDLDTADLILTMTNSHRQAILDQMPEIEHKVQLVSGGRADVSDPYGGSQATYTACAAQLESFLKPWVERLDESLFPQW